MTAPIPTTEPTEVFVNDSWYWDITIPDYAPSDGWTLSYVFKGPTDITLLGGDIIAQSTYWQVRIPPARSNTKTPGTYRWYAYVTLSGERHQVRNGTLVLEADPTANVNAATFEVTTLAVIESAIAGRLTSDLQSYQIHGRAVNKIPIDELVKLRATFRFLVWRQQNPGKSYPQHVVRFVAP